MHGSIDVDKHFVFLPRLSLILGHQEFINDGIYQRDVIDCLCSDNWPPCTDDLTLTAKPLQRNNKNPLYSLRSSFPEHTTPSNNNYQAARCRLSRGLWLLATVYPKKYAHGFVVLCIVVVMQSFIMNSHEVSIHIHQGCFAGTGTIVRLPQCQWSKPDGYGKISQCITTTKHSKAKTVCIFLGIYCISQVV